MKFVHLHTHSHYSLLDGLTKIDDLIRAAKENGADSLAITDHGVMYGVIEFYQKCKKAGIKPIIGVEVYLAPGSRLDKNSKAEERNYHLVLLAKDLAGYKNLIKLTTIAHLEGFYYKPRIDWEVLSRHKDGLIALTACLAGEIPRLILADKLEKCEKRLLEYQELFGADNFYLELQYHPNYAEQIKVNQQLLVFSQKLKIPVVATNDIHYLGKEDDEPQDVLLCLQTKKKKEDRDRMIMLGENFSFRSSREMIEAFKDMPEAIANTVKIAAACNLEIKLGEIQLPYFSVPAGYDCDSYLEEWSKNGLVDRYTKNYEQIDETVRQRLDYELTVIKKMGWSSYFLIVADFVNWAKKNKIVVGPGRGSAAGSLVSYLINVTNIDPLKYDLLFERFLNPDRISMPDIDMDFADARRDEVIRYVEEKYGKDHVAQIITFGTMAARAAVRDVGRVLNYPYDYCDKLAKMIPLFSKIDQALEAISKFKEIYHNEDAARKIIDYARRLEGVARHASTHACGV
ncbi:DNA polymerase III subunit alpha, partial [Candidatus Falkowbacteria bacterium CG_4_9_14_3_um_filter_38_19]